MVDRPRLGIARGRNLNILGNVHHHRAGAARSRDMERLVDDIAQRFGRFHEIVMLGAMPRDADCIGFLKGIGADQVRRDLAGDDDHRDRIHQRVCDAGDGIGRAGARGDEHDAGLAS